MMTFATERDALLNRLAEEFADRYRRGERPALSEYTDRHPELAGEIRELFPALVEIERVEEARREDVGTPPEARTAPPRQLDDYLVLREIGRGGMGVVYEAVQQSLGRHVALKILPWQALGGSSQLERFRLEARSAARLHHTNIVPVFGVGEQDGVHYYAMQFIHGQGLDDVISELRWLRDGPSSPDAEAPDGAGASTTVAASVARALLTGRIAADPPGDDAGVVAPGASPTASFAGPTTDQAGPGPAAEASSTADRSELTSPSERTYYRQVARVGLQVAEGLAYAHSQGILHRDIKPSNLLMDTRGTAWITDFGLAKAEGSDGPTHTGDIVGTLRYMAPERFDGRSDPRSDVYGLGATLYELLTLQPLFGETGRARLIERILHDPPPSPRALDRRIPRDLGTIVLKAIDKDPRRRYATADALAEDLRRFLADEPILARRATAAERYARWARRNPAIATLGAAVTLLVLAVILVLWNGNRAALQALETETGLRAEADRQADDARAVTTFLTNLLTQATEPGHARGQAVTVEDLMVKAEEMLAEGRFDDRPLVEAELRFTIGWIYYTRLFQQDRAEPNIRRALELRERELGSAHLDTLKTRIEYAWVLDHLGRIHESQREIERCWEIARPHFGRSIELPIGASFISYLGLSNHHGMGNRDERRAMLEQAIRDVPRLPREIQEPWLQHLLGCKAGYLAGDGKLAEALRIEEDLRARREGAYRAEHFWAIIPSMNLTGIAYNLGEWEEAESQANAILEIAEGVYPEAHWAVRLPRSLLVEIDRERGELGRARDLLEAMRGNYPDRMNEVSVEIRLAEIAALGGDRDGAQALRARWWDLARQAGVDEDDPLRFVDESHPFLFPQLILAAHVDALCGELDRSRTLCDAILEHGLIWAGHGRDDSLWAMNALARTLATAPETRDNREDIDRALALAEIIVAAQPEVGYFKTTLGIARYRKGDLAGAIDALTTAERLRRDEPTAATHGFYLAMAHHRLGRLDEARSWFDRAVAWMDAHRPDDPGLRDLRTEAEAQLRPAAALPADPFAP